MGPRPGHQLLSCLLESVQSQTPGRKEESHYLYPKEPASPWGLKDFPAGWRQKEGTGKPCLSSVSRWTSPGPSAAFSPLLPTPSSLSTSQTLQHIGPLSFYQSLIFLSESLVTENKKSKIIFSKHTALRCSCLDIWTWVDIRLIASPQHTLRVTAFGWAMWGGGSPEKVRSGIWYQTTHYLQLNLKETLCIYHPGESYEKYLNIKEQQIIKNSCHNNEVESSIF